MSFAHAQGLGLSQGSPKQTMGRAPVPLGVEAMFEKIMDVVTNSVSVGIFAARGLLSKFAFHSG